MAIWIVAMILLAWIGIRNKDDGGLYFILIFLGTVIFLGIGFAYRNDTKMTMIMNKEAVQRMHNEQGQRIADCRGDRECQLDVMQGFIDAKKQLAEYRNEVKAMQSDTKAKIFGVGLFLEGVKII